MLDRHHAWRSLDPTLDICSNFVKSQLPPFFPLLLFFKKTQFLIKEHHFFCICLSAGLSAQLSAGLSAWLSMQLSDASQSH